MIDIMIPQQDDSFEIRDIISNIKGNHSINSNLEVKYCKCGCSNKLKNINRNFISGHNSRIIKNKKYLYKEGVESEDYVVCKICKEKLKQINTTHLKKHKITAKEYELKYGKRICSKLFNLRRENCIKRKSYLATQTKKAQENLRKGIEKYNKSLTKEEQKLRTKLMNDKMRHNGSKH